MSYLNSPKLETISGVRKKPGRQKQVRSLGVGPGHGGVGHQFLGAGHWFRAQGSNNKLWGQIDLGVNFTHPDMGQVIPYTFLSYKIRLILPAL